ncbi:MAG: thioredoxin-disulfide reductase [Deltaproteobacteria bacterium RIFCSPLOWO2_02_FULL_50_16]|nr:MAG: thioredoxin-disulfide reductase [Deltaproteobacteria bacterium RIFCSPLOWO2_02_FULL_50_16]OGQ66964.1 MAG: thioredoxin-disulfide reductase [Deltaproteobacteria bacterium RIFCSPLOWO2_12_FULL_50_11]
MAEKVIIIGSGPAGLTAGLYTARADLKPLLLEGYQAGGQLMLTTEVENFPGYPEGRMGPDLIADIRQQAKRFGARLITKDVTRVNLSKRPFQIEVGKESYETESVILSTGASARLLGLENEKRLMGKGVTTCATCDGAFFRGMEVAMVGGGDSALEEAIFLTRFVKKVSVIHRRDQLRASKIMQERAKKNEKISFVWNSIIEDVLGDKEVTGIRLKNVKTGHVQNFSCSGLFVAIGHTPNTTLFKGQIDLDKNGYILTHEGSSTNIPGVFACGDVQDHTYRQAITAAGSGCMAALDCERYLQSLEG